MQLHVPVTEPWERHTSSTKGFQFCKKTKTKTKTTKNPKSNKQWLFIEVFLATEGVEILQILQESEDVLSWSEECLERKKKKVGSHSALGQCLLPWAGLGWAGILPLPNATVTKCHCQLGSGCIWWLEAGGKLGCHLPSLAESQEPPCFWDDEKQLITLMGLCILSSRSCSGSHHPHPVQEGELGARAGWNVGMESATAGHRTRFSKTGD